MSKRNKKDCRLLVVVSDLHCGSTVGLMPPEAKTVTGNVIGFGDNACQKWLWERWVDAGEFVKRVCGDDPYALAINGDAIDGNHHGTKEIVSPEEEDHIRMAIEVLGDLSKGACKRFVSEGTEVHTKSWEKYLAQAINAETGSTKGKWFFEIAGCLVDMTHHMTTTSRTYLEATQLSILMGNCRATAERSGHKSAKVFLRGHRHCGGYYSDGNGLVVVTGAWQWLTRYGKKVVPDAVCAPSIVVLDWRNKENGELPSVHEKTYNPPQDEIYTV